MLALTYVRTIKYMSRYISLIRHGDYLQRKNAPSAYQPFALTTKGEQQAKNTIQALESFAQTNCISFNQTLYSSSLLRAWQTATIINQNMQHDMSVESSMSLAERSVGYVANLTVSEIEQVLETDPRYETPQKNWKSDSDYCLPFYGAESLMQAGHRVADYLKSIVDKLENDELAIVVGHGAAFRHAAFHLGVLSRDDIAKLSMYHCEPVFLKVPEQQSDKWLHIDGKWKIRQQSEQPD